LNLAALGDARVCKPLFIVDHAILVVSCSSVGQRCMPHGGAAGVARQRGRGAAVRRMEYQDFGTISVPRTPAEVSLFFFVPQKKALLRSAGQRNLQDSVI